MEENALFSCRYFVLLYFVILYLHFLHKLFSSCDTVNGKTLIKSNSKQFHQKKTYATVLTPGPFKTTKNNISFSRRKSIQNKESIDSTYILFFPFPVLFLSVIKIFHSFDSVLDSSFFCFWKISNMVALLPSWKWNFFTWHIYLKGCKINKVLFRTNSDNSWTFCFWCKEIRGFN